MALSRNKPRIYSTVARRNSLQLAATTAVFEGSAIGINASTGRARALVAGDLFAGFAASAASSARDAAGATPTSVLLVTDGEAQLAVPGVTATDIGASVFAVDDDTFALTGSSLVGEVLRVPAAGQAVVAFVGGRRRLSSSQVASGQALVSGAWTLPPRNFNPRLRLGKEVLSSANAASITLQQAWRLPFDIYGFQVGVESNEASSYTLGPLKWALSGSAGDSFGTALADVPNWHLETIASLTWAGATTVTVPARTAADVPAAPTWTDMTYAVIPAGQLLVLRGLHPASPWPYAPAGLASPPGSADVPLDSSLPISVSWNVAGDRVTTPTSYGGNNTNFQSNLPFPFLNVLTSVPTITVAVVGDSTTTGTVNAGQTSYAALQYACELVGTSRGFRFVPHCRGWSNKKASEFYNYALSVLSSAYPPDVLIYQVWSQNNTTDTTYPTELALAADIVSRCRRQGVTPVLLNGIPLNAWTGSEAAKEAARLALNAAVAQWGVPLIDADRVLSDGASPANYLAAYGSAAHPNYAGHQAMAVEYARVMALLVS